MRSLMIPLEILLVRNVNAQIDKGASDLLQETAQQEGIEGIYAHLAYSLLTNLVTTSCKVLLIIIFDVYFDGKIPIKSSLLLSATSIALKQALYFGSLLTKLPFIVLQRRL